MGSKKGDPVLENSQISCFYVKRQIISRATIALAFSLVFLQGAGAEGDGKKQGGLEPVATSSPASKSAMGESPAKQAQNLPKPDAAKSGTGSKGKEAAGKSSSPTKSSKSKVSDKDSEEALPFPLITNDSVASVTGVQLTRSRVFPSAIDIHGSAAGVLLHARKETRYDLLSPLSIWLEDGSLLVSVRRPSEMVLVATKFGDVVVTAGGDALVVRGEDDDLKIVNLSTTGDTVFLNMHDKFWTASPWGHQGKVRDLNDKSKGSKKAYEEIESGAIAIAPGFELLIGAEAITLDEAKPEDSVGRRDFKVFEGGRFLVAEISIDNLTQLHDLIKGLNNHGEKAATVFNEIMKNAGVMKSRQGEARFEKNVPPPPKKTIPRKSPPPKVPASKTPPAKTGS